MEQSCSPPAPQRGCEKARIIPVQPLLEERVQHKKLIYTFNGPYACPPIILPHPASSGPSPNPPSPLNQATISCGLSVHLTFAN